MASAMNLAKRIPLIKFPNRRAGPAGQAQPQGLEVRPMGGKAPEGCSKVRGTRGSDRRVKVPDVVGISTASASSGAAKSDSAPPSLPAGTASSQPHRTRLSKEEIESILLGGALGA